MHGLFEYMSTGCVAQKGDHVKISCQVIQGWDRTLAGHLKQIHKLPSKHSRNRSPVTLPIEQGMLLDFPFIVQHFYQKILLAWLGICCAILSNLIYSFCLTVMCKA